MWSSTAGEGGGAGSVDMVTFLHLFFVEIYKNPPVINLKGQLDCHDGDADPNVAIDRRCLRFYKATHCLHHGR